jgi:hypothetical protein
MQGRVRQNRVPMAAATPAVRELAIEGVPPCVVAGEPFDVVVCSRPATAVELEVRLLSRAIASVGADFVEDPDPLLQVQVLQPMVADGVARLRVAMAHVPGAMRKLFRLQVGGPGLAPAVSSDIDLMSSRLVVRTDASFPRQFYNQSPGVPRFLKLYVRLQGTADIASTAVASAAVADRRVRLHPVLLYDNLQVVDRQSEVMKIGGAKNPTVELNGEEVELQVRIEEVSNRHMKHRFIIMVTAADRADVMSDSSPEVEVLSKKNVRRSAPGLPGQPPHQQQQQQQMEVLRMLCSMGAGSPAIPDAYVAAEPDMAAAAAAATAAATVATSLAAKENVACTIQADSALADSDLEPRQPGKRGIGLVGGSVSTSISAVEQFLASGVQQLAALRWTVLAQESLPDGSTRPLYQVQNPNERIDQLLRAFQEITPTVLALRAALDRPDRDGRGDEDGGPDRGFSRKRAARGHPGPAGGSAASSGMGMAAGPGAQSWAAAAAAATKADPAAPADTPPFARDLSTVPLGLCMDASPMGIAMDMMLPGLIPQPPEFGVPLLHNEEAVSERTARFVVLRKYGGLGFLALCRERRPIGYYHSVKHQVMRNLDYTFTPLADGDRAPELGPFLDRVEAMEPASIIPISHDDASWKCRLSASELEAEIRAELADCCDAVV